MTALENFNQRMVAVNSRFRLIKAASLGPLGADATSYDLCRLDADNPANFTVCYRIEEARDDEAARIAEAFVSGCRWAQDSHAEKSAN